ncbi:MAG: biotin--[Erysipelotrichaceae bacterium]|nr:biotin--[acetyl-CoA-carboxylase] ligase [Erysipelotrichaceae bacterium]MBQ6493201.1 biotin--[acetyl-CoA-carboxylase] ligase [Erysipelotrichaceae bacterium]
MREIYFESIDSTNTYLKQHYEELEDMCFVRTDYQSAGRGRKSRTWLAEKGESLLFSVLLKDEEVLKRYRELSVLSAYSVLEVLEGYGIGDLMIKWPNDVLVKERKICGILLEGISAESLRCIIIGIGLNVKQESFTGDYLNEPVSMRMILNEEIGMDALKDRIYQKLEDNIRKLKEGYDFYEEISAYDLLKGRKVKALVNDVFKEVSVIGMRSDYSLGIIDDGKELNIKTGEISFHV